MSRKRDSEATMQAAAETLLQLMGYSRRSRRYMLGGAVLRGKWFVHLPKTRGNPIVCDLLLLDSARGRYLEVELKRPHGRLSAEQAALVETGQAKVAWNVEELGSLVQAWEGRS
jgi:hypothetical protein